MGLIDPDSAICHTLSLKTLILQSNIWAVLHNHVRSCTDASYALYILPQKGIPRPGIGSIADTHHSLLVQKPSLSFKELRSDLPVMIQVLTQEELLHLDQVNCITIYTGKFIL